MSAADNAPDLAQGGEPPARGTALEVFRVALGLGLTSFGGPIAHLGYFERTYVRRRHWLSAEDFAGLVALCQMVPGPASSQVGFLVGLRRAGWPGACAAWLGFTLPSAVLMLAFAWLAPRLSGPIAEAVFHGLKLVAVAVVAQAVWSMAGKLCPDRPRAALALLAAAILLLFGGATMQLAALAAGALGGVLLCRDVEGLAAPPKLPIGRRAGLAAMTVFVVLLLIASPLAGQAPRSMLGMAAIFYKAGALVFGGGHVVLPLLRDALVPGGWVSDSAFLSGYGAAQAVPGPLFTFAAYLGAEIAPHGASLGESTLWSLLALDMIFLPGLLAALAGLALWSWIGRNAAARGALAGVNAAVVGVLGAALYNPIWTSAILSARDLAVALVAFTLLARWRLAPIFIVLLCVASAVGLALVR
ncbi:MAG TPA: chromate efflux transporter [Caulobacteraceae bacterium]